MANRLAAESSAYLQQHAHNPVDWYPWGDEAWQRARELDRPVLVSIGYSSCHWCHVMERESFEDPEVAALMNERLVCIKVDREERPEVDQIYMDALMRMQGHGGWPLNVFCTPDGRPYHGGTYYPPRRAHGRPSWREIVSAAAEVWRERPDDVREQAERVLEAIRARPDADGSPPPGAATLAALGAQLMTRADRELGGFGDAPKFPTPTQLDALLAASARGVPVAGAREQVLLTLDHMIRGGICDQLGGGFHRYSTDREWCVPHFEKMLYDNGQLLRTCAEAWRQTGAPVLRPAVADCVAWLEREMRSPDGGFRASQDADSEGEEGRFFVWTPAEIRDVLGAERGEAFCRAYDVSERGNFEGSGRSVLRRAPGVDPEAFAAERAALLAARSRRVAPDTDPKQVASWNAYAIGGLACAGSLFAEPGWVELARGAARFVRQRLWDPRRGLARLDDGRDDRPRLDGFLDDHAAMILALCDLYRADADPRWIELALAIAEGLLDRFHDADSGRLYFVAADRHDLVFRPESDADGATPAAAGQAALGLVRLAELTGREDLRTALAGILEREATIAARAPLQLPTLIRAAAILDSGPGLALVIGAPDDPRTSALLERARRLLPLDDAVVAIDPAVGAPKWLDPAWLEGRSDAGDAPTAWLCRGRVCSLPAREPDALELP